MKEHIKKTKLSDTVHIAAHMRFIDKIETEESTGLNPYNVIIRSVKLSNPDLTWTIYYDYKPVAIFGVGNGIYGGLPWLLATDKFTLRPDFVKSFAWAYLQTMLKEYGYLYNYVSCANHKSIRWLKKIGFRVGKPTPFGVKGNFFKPFEMGVCSV